MTTYKKGQRLQVWDIRSAKKGVVQQIEVVVIHDADRNPYISTARGATGHLDIGPAGEFFSREAAAWDVAMARLRADVDEARRRLQRATDRQHDLARAKEQRLKQIAAELEKG